MRKEWLGVLMGLGFAGMFSACDSDTNDGRSSSSGNSKASSSTGQAGSPQGGSAGAGAEGGSGGQSTGGAAGQGGAGGCSSVPPPVGSISDICGGTSASNGSGGTMCSIMCDDEAANTYEVTCNDATDTCSCNYNNQTICTCPMVDAFCSDHCCPAPWDTLGMTGAGGGGGNSVAQSSSAVTSGTTSGSTGP